MYINGLLRCIARPAGEQGVGNSERRGERQPDLEQFKSGWRGVDRPRCGQGTQWLLSKEAAPAPPNRLALMRLNQLCPLPLRR